MSQSFVPHLVPGVWPASISPGRFASMVAGHTWSASPRVMLVGMPDETGVAMNHGKPGAALGPTALRAALAAYGVGEPAGLSLAHLWDAGDVAPGANLDETHARVREAVRALKRAHPAALPVGVGGGHDLTLPFAGACIEHARSVTHDLPIAILQFDPHLDVRSEKGSGMAFRAFRERYEPIACGVVGFNPLVNTREHAGYFEGEGVGTYLSLDETSRSLIFEGGFEDQSAKHMGLGKWLDRLPRACGVVVSFDVDVLDASVAPGVSARNPMGLSVHECARALARIAQDTRVICVDFMELSPPRDEPALERSGDEPGRTARVVAHLLLTFLSALDAQRRAVKRGRIIDEPSGVREDGH